MEESLVATSAQGVARLAETLADIPRVHLRDTEPFTGPGPLVAASSPEMPAPGRPPYPAPAPRRDRPRRHGGRPQGPRPRPRPRRWPSRSCCERPPRQPRAGPPVRRGGPDRRPAPAPRASCRSTSWARFADRRPFFAMKLVKGRTLAALLAERDRARPTTCRGSWRSSSRSARRWPTPTPGA